MPLRVTYMPIVMLPFTEPSVKPSLRPLCVYKGNTILSKALGKE